jgi:hypothetical protein
MLGGGSERSDAVLQDVSLTRFVTTSFRLQIVAEGSRDENNHHPLHRWDVR